MKHPHKCIIDTTCKTNAAKKHFGYVSGNTTAHNWFKWATFMLENQTRNAFFWLFSLALVLLYYGNFALARLSVRVAITDGDDDMIVALGAALDIVDAYGVRCWGTRSAGVFLRRCQFHLFTLNFNDFYKSFVRRDGNVGLDVVEWFKYAVTHAETQQEFLHAFKAIRSAVEKKDITALFTSAAQLQLLAWLDARRLDYKTYCRYVIYGVVDDFENTTNAAESAHHRLKSDVAVNNKTELRILARSDLLSVTQLYKEHEHEHAVRVLEVSLSDIPFEKCARSHLCKRAADDVVKEFMESKYYKVGECTDGSGCALVWRTFADDSSSKLPFRFKRGPRVLREVDGKITCPCPLFVATQKVCRHIIAFNEGNFGPEDVHRRHLKLYFADAVPDASPFLGCINRRPLTAIYEPLPVCDGEDGNHGDDCDDQEQDSDSAPEHAPTRQQRGSMYSILTQKSREIIEKWNDVPVAASKLLRYFDSFDAEMGDRENYRRGVASSRPTPSRGSY
jgi:hypothetical protein